MLRFWIPYKYTISGKNSVQYIGENIKLKRYNESLFSLENNEANDVQAHTSNLMVFPETADEGSTTNWKLFCWQIDWKRKN